MSSDPRPLTYEDLRSMPDDGWRREVIGGELKVNPTPPRNHQEVVANLSWILQRSLRASDWGQVFFHPVDLCLGHHDIVQPDLIVIQTARFGIYDTEGFVDEPPDIVLEVLSPKTRGIDLIQKIALYARSGVPEYWVADPFRKMLAVYVLTGEEYIPVNPASDGTIASRIVPGLRVDPAEVFARLD